MEVIKSEIPAELTMYWDKIDEALKDVTLIKSITQELKIKLESIEPKLDEATKEMAEHTKKIDAIEQVLKGYNGNKGIIADINILWDELRKLQQPKRTWEKTVPMFLSAIAVITALTIGVIGLVIK